MNANLVPYLKIPKYKLVQFIKENIEFIDSDKKPNTTFLNKLTKENIIKLIENEIPFKHWKPYEYFEKYDNPKKYNFQKKLGLQKLTKEELLKLDNYEENYKDPYKGDTPLIANRKTNEKVIIELLEHQKKFLTGFLMANLRSAIAFHGVGTGKTLTAVACSRFYLQLFPKNKVIFISPPAILTNFIESLAFFGVDPRDKRYSYFSYDKWYRSKVNAKNALLIVDEAHNFRTEITFKTEVDIKGVEYEQAVKNKKGASLLNRGGKMCHKCLLLTATPFVNKTYDIENLLAIGDGRDPLNEEAYGELASNYDMRYDYFKYRISHYERTFDNSDFPERREIFVPLVVPEEEEVDIRATAGKQNPFYIYSRQNSTTVDDMKIEYVINEIKKNKNDKFVIYTTFRETGYEPLYKMLKKNNISFSSITGNDNQNSKDTAIQKFNQYYNESYIHETVRVIIISRAGAEGVDLRETTTIFIMDGQWNDALYEQIVARAIRYKSHSSLPKNKQFVNVKKLFACYESEKSVLEKLNKNKTVDFMTMLNSILETREEISKIKKIESDKSSNKSQEELFQKFINFGDMNFSTEELEKLKKGSTERRLYLEKNKSFSKKKETYISSELSSLNEKMPSTDFYMFIMQKVKMNIINAFIKQIDKIPNVEKSFHDLEFGKKMFKLINDGKMDNKDFVKNLMEHIRKDMTTAINKIETVRETEENKLKKFLKNKHEISELQKNKNLVKIKQEYFTPENEALKLIQLSKIEKEYKKFYNNQTLNILEPTAGQGGLVLPLLELVKKEKVFFKIDMVEYTQVNRDFLKSLCDKIPDILNLEKTNDFLRFIPNKNYHFIFMNPPFHLDKKFNKHYDKDYYDYDFVKRAYAMLELNGVLVAITGQNYKKNKEILKWYESKNAVIKDDTVKWTGENLKKGAEIQALKLSYVFIRKINDDPKETNELLKININDKENNSKVINEEIFLRRRKI